LFTDSHEAYRTIFSVFSRNPNYNDMKDVHKDPGSLLMARTTLRIPRDVVQAIDAECSRRAGSVSRNTWIIEAVMEKLTRHSSVTRPQSDGIGNG
jgi:hypothetical protein